MPRRELIRTNGVAGGLFGKRSQNKRFDRHERVGNNNYIPEDLGGAIDGQGAVNV